ncbi:MAG: hypothetical protein QOG23_128 [Blastocatellia bacterium]|jgi:hypothetical protein|nr:hypothetical protein [Blastocatellia bacterium]
MLRKFIYLLAVIVWLAGATVALGQDQAGDVHVKLALVDNKTSFRAGDPIRLVLEFTADHEGYDVDTVTDKTSSPSDKVFISPDTGVFHWLDEYLGGSGSFRDYFTVQKLSSTPTRVELILNYLVRFERPGRYSVKVRTSRVTQRKDLNDRAPRPITLSSNEVSFDVQLMSEADEAKEVQRLSAALDVSRDVQSEEKLTQELLFLTGDTASREKVRRFLNAEDRSGNYFQNISLGLYNARNRALVFQLLEAALRDPNRPVSYGLLATVTKLKLLRQNEGLARKPVAIVGMMDSFGDPQYNAIQDAYVTELAAGLSKRAGKSQTITAMTILSRLPKTQQTAALNEVRQVLIQQFQDLHPFDQEYLLREYWDQLHDPSLLPSIKQMLSGKDKASKMVHDTALKRLIEVAPDEARSFVIAEVVDPTSLVNFEILRSLADPTLPETDAPLLEQIRRFSSSTRGYDVTYLKQKASLAARYASVGIYQSLMELYQQSGAKLPLESRACLLAYFARYNENEALPLIDQVLTGIEPGQDFNFLPDLARLYYSDGIDGVLRKRLESDEPRAVSTAAYLMSKYGPAGDQQVIEARLERWRKEWGSRAAEAQANLQGTAEREMVEALIRAKSWKASPERVKELEQGCITDFCRQNFRR